TARGGEGDGAVARAVKEMGVAREGAGGVEDNTKLGISPTGGEGGGGTGDGGLRQLTTGKGADNTPRYSPDGHWLAYLSLERPGFEADRERLMLVGRTGGWTEGRTVEVTAGWTRSVRSYTWCHDSKRIYAVVEESGRATVSRI